MAGGWDLFGFGGGLGADPSAVTAARLSPRQRLSFNHRADLWRPSIVTVGNKRIPGPYVLAETDVRCHREIKGSMSIPTELGRVESDVSDSADKWHFAEDQVIDEGWFIIDRSINPRTGGQGNSWGRAWIVRGQPSRIMASERREAGKVWVLASQEARAPIGVS